MSRHSTSQAAQRAAVSHRRRTRGPISADPKGPTLRSRATERSQAGISYDDWAAGKVSRFARVGRVALLHRR